MKKIIVAVTAFGALALSACGGTPAVPAPAPAPTVTATVTAPPVVQTKTVEKKVEVTPDACRTFLYDSNKLVGLEAQAIQLAGEGFEAASNLDGEEMSKINEKLNKLAPKIVKARNAYEQSSDDCSNA
jgi:hypothetical protein